MKITFKKQKDGLTVEYGSIKNCYCFNNFWILEPSKDRKNQDREYVDKQFNELVRIDDGGL